ncbi:MAG TPA: TlpA disulfide reductase family protein [Marinobacter sp.]|nr:TlpA disulfide reductase family protein [Marinobacter sp.]
MVHVGLILLIFMAAGCQKIELERADGVKVNWEQLRGQWVLVNYWAEWCKPCLEEIPELNMLDKSPDITVFGVNFDGIQGPELNKLAQRMGIDYTLLAEDPGPRFGWELPVALPATFIVKPDGTLVEVRFGPQTKTDIHNLIDG